MSTKKITTANSNYTYTVEGNQYAIYAQDGEYLNTVTKVSATKGETTHSTHKTLGAACDFLNEAYEAYDEADCDDIDETAEIETEEEREERENREWEEEKERMQQECDARRAAEAEGEARLQARWAAEKIASDMDARAEMEAWEKQKAAEEAEEEADFISEDEDDYEAIRFHNEIAAKAAEVVEAVEAVAPELTTLADEMKAELDLAFVADFATLKEWWDKYSGTHDLIRRKDSAKAVAVADWGATSGKPVAEITLDNGKSSTPYYHALAKYFTVTRK